MAPVRALKLSSHARDRDIFIEKIPLFIVSAG
jgi:hypothetical protein